MFQNFQPVHPMFNPRRVGGPFEITLPAYPSVYMDKPKNLEDGDKILLPEGVLRSLMHGPGAEDGLPQPLTFEIKNIKYGSVSHCGVLEFSQSQHRAILPQWMMENLVLSPGDKVRLQVKQLPKLKFVLFKPLNHSFSKTENPKAALEHSLRKFTTLTHGDSIMIHTSNASHTLHVATIEPSIGDPAAGCIVDSDLQVDFDVPYEEKGEDAPPEVIKLETQVDNEVSANSYRYYKIKLVHPELGVRFALTPLTGDPDLYISTSIEQPTVSQHDWAANTSQAKLLGVHPGDPKFSENWYFIGVYAYKKASSFSLYVSQVPSDEPQTNGTSIGHRTNSYVDHANDPNFEKCANCWRFVPKSSSTMHSMHCARNNWRCPVCNAVIKLSEKDSHAHCPQCQKVMSPDDLEKHIDLSHRPILCECGIKVDPDVIQAHKETECVMRLVQCKWCETPISLKRQISHQNYCGGKTVPCPKCNQPVARNKLLTHDAVAHDINPCLPGSGDRLHSASVVPGAPTGSSQQYPISEDLSAVDRGDPMLAHQDTLEQVLRASREEHQLQEAKIMEEVLRESAESSNPSISSAKLEDGKSDSAKMLVITDEDDEITLGVGSRQSSSRRSSISISSDENMTEQRFSPPSQASEDILEPNPQNISSHDAAEVDIGYHEFKCPYCAERVSLLEDMEDHMASCSSK
uniref:Ubiquitin fusion degradation protein 1 homolog n=1 Tax=Hirondellea gigas TaxID=1518452 RepID=A0A6A7G9P6_9CRUS